MKTRLRNLCLAACLMAAAPLWAQGTFVSPPAFATKEGNASCYMIGYYANEHIQLMDGEMRGTKRALTQVAFRLDYQNHNYATATGRKWTQVTLSVCDCEWTQASSTFTKNQLTTPVEVFNAAVSFPTAQGTPFLQPTPFGGAYGFAFKSPYTYTGDKDVLLDFVFRGGTLDNNVAWSGGNTAQYHLDSDNTLVTYSSPQTWYPASEPSTRCRDSAISSNVSAYTYATLQVHGIIHPTPTYRDKAEFNLYSYYTAPNARIITAIAFGGNSNGVNVGASCAWGAAGNKLYANIQGPWLALGRTTSGSAAYSGTFTTFAPWSAAMANLPIWVQTAWEDSSLKAFSLTRAMMVMMPPDKPRPGIKLTLYHYDLSATGGYGPYVGSYWASPISRFSYN